MLNPKQRRFIAEYLKDENGTQAAIRAGYSKKTAGSQAFDLLRKPEIKKEIDSKLAKIETKSGITKEWVLSSLKEVAERCMQRVPVMVFDREEKSMVRKVDDEGRDVWEFDSSGANKALELIGRHLAMFTDKIALSESLEKLIAGSNPPREKE